jgi:hypothetical protein
VHVQCAPGLLSHDGSAINERHASPATHNPMNLFFHANAGSLVPTPCKCPETPNATAVSHRTYIAQTLRVQHPHRQPLLLLLLRCPATVLQRPDTAKSVSPPLLLGKGDSHFPGGAPASRLQCLCPLDPTTAFSKTSCARGNPHARVRLAIACTWPTSCQICHSCSC